jgi:peptidoglycan/LPS O-acetylase OafA/YrhL
MPPVIVPTAPSRVAVPHASGWGYRPALDGLRGVSVLAVLAFHGGMWWATGGYLGVSVFFTLSGFLITSLLLVEHDRTGTLDLRAFYGRRIRRLAPAALCCLVAIAIIQILWSPFGGNDLGPQLRWSALQAANWQQLADGHSYADLFQRQAADAASPVEHFWSLAVEEQFYLLWPAAVLVLCAVARGSRRAVTGVLVALLAVAAVAAPVIARVWGPDVAYLASPARAAELFAGAVLAALCLGRTLPGWLRWAGLGALVAIGAAVVMSASGGGWAYHGGLPLFAALSAIVIAAAHVGGPVRRLLEVGVLVALGRISYGLYLFHWPIFVLLSPARTGWSGWGLFGLRLAVTLGVALLSFRLLEQPLRTGSISPSRVVWGAAAATLAVAVGAVLVVSRSPSVVLDAAQIDATKRDEVAIKPQAATDGATAPAPGTGVTPVPTQSASSAAEPSTTAAEPSTTTAPRPRRILVVGDSTGSALGSGLVEWAYGHPDLVQVSVGASGACGIVRGGEYRDTTLTAALEMTCGDLIWKQVPAMVAELQPDVVAVSITLADTWARSWDGGHTWLRPTDGDFRQRLDADYAEFFAQLVAAGAGRVVWLRPPTSSYDTGSGKLKVDRSFVDGSQQVVEEAVTQQIARFPSVVTTLDFAGWFTASPLSADARARPDGTHLTVDAAAVVAQEWLGPALVASAGV